MRELPMITVSLTVNRVPAHWLCRMGAPRLHLIAACDRHSNIMVLPYAATRRRAARGLLVCQHCQKLLDRMIDDASKPHPHLFPEA
jgi:hypothetical protein